MSNFLNSFKKLFHSHADNMKTQKLVFQKAQRKDGYFVKDVAGWLELERTVKPKFDQPMNMRGNIIRQYANYYLYKSGVGVTDVYPILPRQVLTEEQELYVRSIYAVGLYNDYMQHKKEINDEGL